MAGVINKIVKTLIVSDLFLNFGWGLLSPVFALFILSDFGVANASQAAQIAGLASLFYWIPKSFFQIPISTYLDNKHGEKDDFWFMVCGLIIVSVVPIGYFFANVPWHIYVLQVIYAFGMAMTIPSWSAIFTRHIDKGKEAFEWSMKSNSVGMGAGIAGGLSGIVAANFGFGFLLTFVSLFTLVAASLLLIVKNNVFIRDGHPTVYAGERPIIEP